jgi:alpha-L-fucosidase 2
VEVKKPIIAETATIKPLAIAPTYLYDIKTEKGKSYSFLIK